MFVVALLTRLEALLSDSLFEFARKLSLTLEAWLLLGICPMSNHKATRSRKRKPMTSDEYALVAERCLFHPVTDTSGCPRRLQPAWLTDCCCALPVAQSRAEPGVPS